MNRVIGINNILSMKCINIDIKIDFSSFFLEKKITIKKKE